MIGSTLSHFKITAKLGEGGMGEVYRAEDTRLERPVALKLLREGLTTDPERLDRFLREAKLLAALNHPGIVTVYSVEEAAPAGSAVAVHFLAMELVEGDTLRDRLPQGGFALADFLDLAIPIADAVAAAHDKGIVHRDLKPGNVMITRDRRIKVLDFGLAYLQTKELSGETDAATLAMTEPGTVLGTFPYMSPEQIQGGRIDHRSDVFSLGVVLYEMITGVRPFDGDNPALLLSSILRDEPAPLTRIRPEMPRELERILGRCLQKDTGNRLQTARDLRNQLEELRRELARPAADPPAATDRTHSLAVLPLTNLSADPEQEFFVDGMTEALITGLAKIRALKVISRTSVMQYKHARKPLPEIGRELGVDGILEGSVLRVGNRVRITAQLIEAATDRHVWAESYERDLSDVLELQSEVAQAIVAEIQVKATPEEERQLAASKRVHPEAHEAYLRGRFFWNRRTAADFRRARECFETAIEHDPEYALAWVGLSDTYTLLERYSAAAPRDVMPRARAAAERALELDPTLAEAYASRGLVAFYFDYDRQRARRDFDRAIELKPGYPVARHWSAWLHAAEGRFDEALDEIGRAHELDPLSLILHANVGTILYFARRFDDAIRTFRSVIDLDPGFAVARQWLGRAYEQTGEIGRAVAEHAEALRILGDDPESIGSLGRAQGLAGRADAARSALERLRQLGETRFVSTFWSAVVDTGLGANDRALDGLESAYEERFDWLNSLQVDAMFDGLRSDPRFEALLGRLGFSSSSFG